LIAEGLRQKRLARAGRADKKNILRFANEATSGQIEDLGTFDGRIEREVELVTVRCILHLLSQS
jgi:hypothetical protein